MIKKLAASFIMLLSLAVSALAAETADTVITGTIWTGEASQPWARAAAIKDGSFIYVGDASGVKRFIGADTKLIMTDRGSLIIPGMCDSHAHGFMGMKKELFQVDLVGMWSLDEYREAVKTFIDEHGDADVIYGMGWENSVFGPDGPNSEMLDDLTDKPIILRSVDGHTIWANSSAMTCVGVDAKTADVPNGVIVRRPDGSPTGCFREEAMALIEPLEPKYTLEQGKQIVLAYQDKAASLGDTMFLNGGINYGGEELALPSYMELDREGKLRSRAFAAYVIDDTPNAFSELDAAARLMEATKDSRHFKVTNVKFFVDGVIEGETAALHDDYAHHPGHRGELRWDPKRLAEAVEYAYRLGLTVHMHAIGDAAVTVALDAIENAQRRIGDEHGYGSEGPRSCITHAQLTNDSDIERFSRLGVVAALNAIWAYKERGYFEEIETPYLGIERAESEYKVKSFFDAGVVVTTATDYPVTNPPAHMNSIGIGVNRREPWGNDPATLLGPSERATVEQMLTASTINGAYQLKCEDVLGSIAPGKYADFVVLGRDITKCAPTEINSTPVLMTVVGGKTLFEKK